MNGGEGETAKRYNSILEIIDKRLIPDEGAKKARGEVFTPLNLVREMLFGLRKSALEKGETVIWGINDEGNFFDDKESDRVGGIPLDVWRDPNTKWLDPANGIGNFPVVAFYMLDYQLGNHGPAEFKGDKNKEKRRKHIVKNMLYMIELNKGNVNTSRKIFDKIVPGVEANIICANTLKLTDADLKREFGVNRFDVIMGNPPFNSGGVKSSGIDKGTKYFGQPVYETIWPYFIDTIDGKKEFPGALNLLNKNGYLCFIHPSPWLHKNDIAKLHDVLLSYPIDIIRIYTNFQANKLFKSSGAVRCAYYILKNSEISNNSINIIDIEHNYEIIKQSKEEIFSSYNKLLQNVFIKLKKIGDISYLNSKGLLKPKKDKQYSTGPYLNICQHLENGVNICKTKQRFIDLEEPKIIFKGTSKLYHFDDLDGKYGIYGNWGFYIKDTKSILQRFSQFFDTNIAKLIMIATKEDQDFIEPKYLPDIREIPQSIKMNDKDLCKYFNIDYDTINKTKLFTNQQKILNTYNNCSQCGMRGKKTQKVNGGSRQRFNKTRRNRA